MEKEKAAGADPSVITVIYSIPYLCLYPGVLLDLGFFPPLIAIFCHFVFVVYKDSQYVTAGNEKITNNIPPRFARPGNLIPFSKVIIATSL